jgi:acetyltransferase-like isoleucine patch superfamily enzyme
MEFAGSWWNAAMGNSNDQGSPPAVGAVDRFIRRFNSISHVLAILALYAVAITAIGAALAPALWFLDQCLQWCAGLHGAMRWLALGSGIGVAFFIAGFALLVVVPIYNLLLPTKVRSFKGGYFSIAAVPWYLHNGLFYLVRYTFLPYVTLTPFGTWFLRAMGMKIGQRVFINSEFISDPRMITLEDDVVIGGSVHLFAHYGGGGHLTIAPVVIGARATIGEKSTVMGDVRIGAHATILPHSALLPGSRVGEGETWGGVPARRITDAEMEQLRQGIHGVLSASPHHRPR